MPRYFTMHPENPQQRLIKQAAEALLAGELLAYPTDSGYALGSSLESSKALATLREIRGLDEKHPLTLICHSISQASTYCLLSDRAFSIFKTFTPGPYTFVLQATKKVPRPAQGMKRKNVGIRIPRHPIALALVEALGSPILSSTLWIAGDDEPISDPTEIALKTRGKVDLILDGGICSRNPTSMIDLVGDQPQVIRKGLGDTAAFE